MSRNQIGLIKQALSAAESSIAVAQRLLREIEGGRPPRSSSRGGPPEVKIYPGTVGIFDGVNLVTRDGQKHQVPGNYVSKSMIVVGDTLKRVTEGSEVKYKQIQRVKRKRLSGVVAQKEGKYHVVTDDGSYKVFRESVEHFGLSVGDKVEILTSAVRRTPWAVIERAVKESEGPGKAEPEPAKEAEKPKEALAEEKKKPTKKAASEEKKEVKKTAKKEEPAKEEKKTQEVKGEVVVKKETGAKTESKKEKTPAKKKEVKTAKKEEPTKEEKKTQEDIDEEELR